MSLSCYHVTFCVTLQALYWWGRLGRSKMKEDGANEEDWVSGVADLVGIGRLCFVTRL
jgi:hypothetical protein